MIKEAIQLLVDHKDLSSDIAQQTMREIMTGEATPSQVGAFLISLRMKGETVEEIAALATVMRQNAVRINPLVKGRTVDTCGTGGDRLKTFNVSTSAALVACGAGVPIAKHGNRSVTSKCGSADVLEALGVNLNTPPSVVQRSIEQIGIGFMFAPTFHPAMKNAIAPRREIGIRTVFNVLGPLTNPANANAQVLGVYDSNLVEPMAKVLQRLGTEEAIVVHGLDGLDEISTVGKTKLAWFKNGSIISKEIIPQELNLKQTKPNEISGFDVNQSAKLVVNILQGQEDKNSSRLQIVLANAAAAILVGGKSDDLASGVEIARESIDSGRAYEKLENLVEFTNGETIKLERIAAQNA
ncbi:MAG TPA: anthranilate phosphoribosyltransferase [Candidatus Acidoferrales bacterium]|nr:anthranilate phosphoribosyltransferase [Candidatus Acidoferrales bacterium]